MSSKSKRKKPAGRPQSQAPRKPGRRRANPRLVNAARVAALMVASIAVAIVLAEVGVRAVYGKKFGPRPGFFTGDKVLGWKPSPNLNHTFYGPDYEIRIRTDADGYRLGALGEVDYSKDLIMVCGDSYAFGWGVSTEETFPSFLDEIVYLESGGTTRVVNLGVGGYGLFQSCDRLHRFARDYPDAKIKAVVVQHTVNDAIDNCKAIGYHLEMWETEDLSKPRSRWHLVNLVGFVRQARSQGKQQEPDDDAGANHPYVQDLLWAFQRVGGKVDYPGALVVEGRRTPVDAETLDDDWNPQALIERGKLSPVQRGFALEGFHCLHKVCKMLGVAVVHVFVTTTPEWYVEEMTELAIESARFRDIPVLVPGRVPEPGAFEGPSGTGHSGGHFNAGFNRLWAGKAAALIGEALDTP